ncbi:MAG: RNA 2',3'-cyclic phosphodiesterase [Betaproteobacteria bacterium]|nr:RNA 2',3'-cyclic phosphodiesterase [Betaproteobacteria bacterium]
MKPATARVFFALWPDDACAGRLHEIAVWLAAGYGGRATARSTLHLTLAFVGDVAEDKLADLMSAAGQVREEVAPLETAPWRLDRLSYWPHNRILWAGSDGVPPAIGRLAGRLVRRLREKGYPLPVRPFVPHVTLVRKVERAPIRLDGLKVSQPPWRYEQFVLLRSRLSERGASYETLGAWALNR